VSELVHVGVSGLLLGPSGSDERTDELTERLVGIGSELPALLGGGLVVDERAVDAPMDPHRSRSFACARRCCASHSRWASSASCANRRASGEIFADYAQSFEAVWERSTAAPA
jgi:hypothetical protein